MPIPNTYSTPTQSPTHKCKQWGAKQMPEWGDNALFKYKNIGETC